MRKADRRDAKRLAELAERSFRDTFGAANTAENMDLHCGTSYGEAIQAREIASPHIVTLLSEAAGTLAGFAQVSWGPAPACVAGRSPGEIQRLYAAREWHGKGVAQGLMDACFEELRARGSDVVWLGVWERNPRAIAFYTKSGFREVGDHVFKVGADPQRDIVMARSIRSEARVELRRVEASDLPIFFEHQLDPEANRMAAFTRKDHADEAAFKAHWAKILSDATITPRTITVDGRVAGNIGSFKRDGVPEITYWLGKEFWGRGVATSAVKMFLDTVVSRPLYARVAKDNRGSVRVLEKCGFRKCGEDKGFANARGAEIEEVILELSADREKPS